MNKDNVKYNYPNLKALSKPKINQVYQTAITELHLQQFLENKDEIDYWSEVAANCKAILKAKK